MTVTLEQILGFENMLKVMATPFGGVPNVWGPEFLTIKEPGIVGDTATWLEAPNSRQTAPTTNYGSASRRLNQQSTVTRQAKCIHSYTNMVHQMPVLTALRNYEQPTVQARGRQYIDFQTVEAQRKYTNLRISAITSAFRYGAIYFDGAGNMLPTSSGATLTVNFNVPANNQNQLNSAISAAWSTAGTDILNDLLTIQLRAVQGSGLPLTRAYYGSSIPHYLAENTAIANLLDSDAMLASQIGMGKIPANFGFEGLRWIPLHTAFFEDAAGDNQTWFPSDFVVFMPEPSAAWYGMIEGSFEVPDGALSIRGTAADCTSDMRSITGMGTYAKLEDDPPGIKQFFVDTFLPALKVPSAIYIADTVA